jgi:hypothetical protein
VPEVKGKGSDPEAKKDDRNGHVIGQASPRRIYLRLVVSIASNPCLRVKGTDKQIQSLCVPFDFLFALYLFHLTVIPHNNLGLRKKT